MTQTVLHHVGGRGWEGKAGRLGDVYNPATGERTRQVAMGGASEVDAAVRAAAAAFTAAWLRRSVPAAEWLDGLRPLATQRLITNLTGVDPMDVPVVQAVGAPVVLLRSDLYAQVRLPIDASAVLLGMVKQGDRWLVDTLDEDRP